MVECGPADGDDGGAGDVAEEALGVEEHGLGGERVCEGRGPGPWCHRLAGPGRGVGPRVDEDHGPGAAGELGQLGGELVDALEAERGASGRGRAARRESSTSQATPSSPRWGLP